MPTDDADRRIQTERAADDLCLSALSAGLTKRRDELLLRERAPLAETVIEDFARWEDWRIAPRLMEIHAGGNTVPESTRELKASEHWAEHGDGVVP